MCTVELIYFIYLVLAVHLKMSGIFRRLISFSVSSSFFRNSTNSIHILNNVLVRSKYLARKLIALQRRQLSITSQNILSIENPDVQKYMTSIEEEYESLQNTKNDLTQDVRERLAALGSVVSLINERKALLADSAALKLMEDEKSADDEFKGMVLEEITNCRRKIEEIDEQILFSLLPKDPLDNSGALLEVSAGVGGKEAMLFSRELFDMYCNYADYRGGLRHSSALISGNGPVYGLLSKEAGVHRVQRIPVTEKSGRVHTSTVKVAVLPQPSELDVEVKKEDLKIETKRAGGAGGQHVNTTDSISVECQTDRSQFRNKEMALLRLRAKLYEEEKKKRDKSEAATRKEQVGEAA
ncbi:hypothetical protein J437_LFUL018843, partial [Ladona fulva]